MSEYKNIGNRGESIVCNYLVKNNYKILCRNYHTRYGEIDIIAEKETFIVFVEVKVRKINSIISGLEAVDIRKQKKIIKTAECYLLENNVDLQPRFDVFELIYYFKNGTKFLKHMRHFESAFCLEDSYNNEDF